ncbi:inorganic diphosphatase [Niabella insulamsoli]|uniref:inorganic diphosphatase n=1 Tax=Niabella insulamsoli TaxID=3144874 RepID=UPI0031FD4FA2
MYQTNIIVETPRGHREKFNYDPRKKCFYLKKVLPWGMSFPFDFGFIPDTKGQDGDPLDALIISDLNTFVGCQVDCYLLGSIQADQIDAKGEKIRNDRYLFAPVATWPSHENISTKLLSELEDFFINYNKAEGKTFIPLGFASEREAVLSIKKSM